MQQTVSRPPDTNSNNQHRQHKPTPPRKILILALLLFSIAGLALGYTTGVVAGPKKSSTSSNTTSVTQNRSKDTTQPTAQPTQPLPTATKTVNMTPLSCPTFKGFEVVSATPVLYETSWQAGTYKGKTACPATTELKDNDISFKIWLVKGIDIDKDYINIDKEIGKNIQQGKLDQPITVEQWQKGKNSKSGDLQEETNGLTFDTSTPQIQKSDTKGQVKWRFSPSSSLAKGNYLLVVLSARGPNYSWSWIKLPVA